LRDRRRKLKVPSTMIAKTFDTNTLISLHDEEFSLSHD